MEKTLWTNTRVHPEDSYGEDERKDFHPTIQRYYTRDTTSDKPHSHLLNVYSDNYITFDFGALIYQERISWVHIHS